MLKALGLVQSLRSTTKAVLPLLAELDTGFAKNNEGATWTFSELGNDVVATVELLAKRLENVRGVEAPSTRAKWKSFVGKTALALCKAGVPLTEVAALFALPGAEQRVERRLRRRKNRSAAGTKKPTKRSR